MSYWVLTANGTVVSRTTVSRDTNIEAQTDENKSSITALDKAIQEYLNDKNHVIVERGKGEPRDWSEHPFDSVPGFQEEFSHVVSNEEVINTDDESQLDVYDDTYLNMEVYLPKLGEPKPHLFHVTKRLHYANGIPVGKSSDKHILDTLMYKVEYVDGKKSALYANLIAENMFA